MLAIANSYVFSAQMTLWIKSKRHDSIIFLYTGILPAFRTGNVWKSLHYRGKRCVCVGNAQPSILFSNEIELL